MSGERSAWRPFLPSSSKQAGSLFLVKCHFSTIKNTQFSTSLDERDPDLVEETELNPTLERAMDRTIVREVSGELIPLTPWTRAGR